MINITESDTTSITRGSRKCKELNVTDVSNFVLKLDISRLADQIEYKLMIPIVLPLANVGLTGINIETSLRDGHLKAVDKVK